MEHISGTYRGDSNAKTREKISIRRYRGLHLRKRDPTKRENVKNQEGRIPEEAILVLSKAYVFLVLNPDSTAAGEAENGETAAQ